MMSKVSKQVFSFLSSYNHLQLQIPFRITGLGIYGHFKTKNGALKNDSCANKWKEAYLSFFFFLLTNLTSTNYSRPNFFHPPQEKMETLKIALSSSLPYNLRSLRSLDNVLGTRASFALICELIMYYSLLNSDSGQMLL